MPEEANKPAAKKATKKKMTNAEKVLRPCHLFLTQKTAYGVDPGPMGRVFVDNELKKSGRCTWYQLGMSHVMPLGHALMFSDAGHVTKGSISLLPEGKVEPFTGIVTPINDPAPKPVVEAIEFEDSFDLDAADA